MVCSFERLSPEDGRDVYAMLQDIGRDENGFTNEVCGMTYPAYKEWLAREHDISMGISLPDGWIPQTTFFLYVDGLPVGIARIRHRSDEMLERRGVGNFGYGIARGHRGKGYGRLLFDHVVKACAQLGYTTVRSFVHIDNAASKRIFEAHGARLVGVFHGEKNIYETRVSG